MKDKSDCFVSHSFQNTFQWNETLPKPRTCKCCQRRFIPKDNEQEFCSKSCELTYQSQVNQLNYTYILETDNGCLYHKDCFTCPYPDCIVGEKHYS